MEAIQPYGYHLTVKNRRIYSLIPIGVFACSSAYIGGCASLSTAFDNTICAIAASGVPTNLENAIEREIAGQGPNGEFGQTSSRENWDRYWNDRIYSLWDSVPDCGGRSTQPTGREAILASLLHRKVLGLPDVQVEGRNGDKDLPIASLQAAAPLVHAGIINAPLAKVWDSWSTSEGLRSWLAPHAEIDFRIGGTMRANYSPDGELGDPQTIENTILYFDRSQMIAIRVSKAPADFPFPNAIYAMWTEIYFQADGPDRTSIRIVADGFSADQEAQAMRAFFDQGNAVTLRQMQERIGTAPP